MSRYSILPAVAGLVAAGVGVGFRSPQAALVWGLVGYFLTKTLQSTIWTLFGDTRH